MPRGAKLFSLFPPPRLSFFLLTQRSRPRCARPALTASSFSLSPSLSFLSCSILLAKYKSRLSRTSAAKRGAESASANKFEAARALRSWRFSLRVNNEEERKRRAELSGGNSSSLGNALSLAPAQERRAAPAQAAVCAVYVLGIRQQCRSRQALHTRPKHAACACLQ